jgi:excisionase family DNA binding protein
MSNEDKLLNPRQVAELLGVSVPFAYLLAAERRIPSFKIGTCRRFSLADVKAFLAKSRQEGPEAA